MLQNDVYSYDYRIVGRDVSDKKEFCSKSNAEDIVNSDYKHPKRVWKDFKKYRRVLWSAHEKQYIITCRYIWKSQQVYWDISTWSHKLFISTRIGMTGILEKGWIKVKLLINIDILLIPGGICDAIHRYAKANKKYTKESS